MQATIIDRGRGPEIAGTRITVYSVLDYLQLGWHTDRIAVFLRLSSDQVRAAERYIEDHRPEVMEKYQIILDRCARGNPPELQAKLDAGHVKFLEMVAERRRQKLNGNGAN